MFNKNETCDVIFYIDYNLAWNTEVCNMLMILPSSFLFTAQDFDCSEGLK